MILLILSLGMLGIFFFCRLLIFLKITSFKKFLRLHKHYQSVKHMDPDQDQHSVGPGLGPSCLQRLTAEDKSHLWQEKNY